MIAGRWAPPQPKPNGANNWKIVYGRLYLNLDDGIQQMWLKDIAGNIKKAEGIWPGIKGKLPTEL